MIVNFTDNPQKTVKNIVEKEGFLDTLKLALSAAKGFHRDCVNQYNNGSTSGLVMNSWKFSIKKLQETIDKIEDYEKANFDI